MTDAEAQHGLDVIRSVWPSGTTGLDINDYREARAKAERLFVSGNSFQTTLDGRKFELLAALRELSRRKMAKEAA